MPMKELSMAICGMQGMSSIHPSTIRLLGIFTSLLQSKHLQSNITTSNNVDHLAVTGEQLGPIISGLKRLSSDHSSVIAFISSILNIIPTYGSIDWKNQRWNEQNIANAFHGLQSLSSEHNITLVLVQKLVGIFQSTNVTLSYKSIGSSLNGTFISLLYYILTLIAGLRLPKNDGH
jgi:hypothetical protein